MNKLLLSSAIACCLMLTSPQISAQTESYFATGEDIDNLMNNDDMSTLLEIEDKLQESSFFQALQKYFFNVNYMSIEEAEGEDLL